MNTTILTEITATGMNPMELVITDFENQGVAQMKETENRTIMKATSSVAVINQETNIVIGMGK